MADTFFGIPGAGQDNDAIAQQKSSARIAQGMREAGSAYSNKRQSDRDFYGNALGNRAAAYQGAVNMLGASGGGVPNMGGLDRRNNPLTLQDTGIGATAGSNWTGWDNPSPYSRNGVAARGGHTNGIQDYLNGTTVQTGSGGQGVTYGNAYTLPDRGVDNGSGGSINTNWQQPSAVTGSATAPMWANGQPSGPPPAPPPSPGQNFNFGRRA